MATSTISNIDRNYFEAALNQNSGSTLSVASFYRVQATSAGGNIIAVWSRPKQGQYLCVGIWNANGFSLIINNGGFTLNSVSTSVLSINVPGEAGNIALFSVGRPVYNATFT